MMALTHDDGELVIHGPLTTEEARRLTDEVKGDVANLWLKVLALYEGAAHAALDYGSWREYWEAEFGGDGSRGDQYIRAGRIARVLHRSNLPLPANDAVARALQPVMRYAPDELEPLWSKALEESGGSPTSKQVARLTEPYRRRRPVRVERSADGRTIRRLRHAVAGRLLKARHETEAARKGVANALGTEPKGRQVRDWINIAREARDELDRVIEELSRYQK